MPISRFLFVKLCLHLQVVVRTLTFSFFFLEGGGDRSLCIPEAGTCLQQDFSPGTKIPVIVMFYLF